MYVNTYAYTYMIGCLHAVVYFVRGIARHIAAPCTYIYMYMYV